MQRLHLGGPAIALVQKNFAMLDSKNEAQKPDFQFLIKSNILKLLLSNSVSFKPCMDQRKHASKKDVTSGHPVCNSVV